MFGAPRCPTGCLATETAPGKTLDRTGGQREIRPDAGARLQAITPDAWALRMGSEKGMNYHWKNEEYSSDSSELVIFGLAGVQTNPDSLRLDFRKGRAARLRGGARKGLAPVAG